MSTSKHSLAEEEDGAKAEADAHIKEKRESVAEVVAARQRRHGQALEKGEAEQSERRQKRRC